MAATFKGSTTVKTKKQLSYGVDNQIDCTITFEGSETQLQTLRTSSYQNGTSFVCDTLGNVVTVRNAQVETASRGPVAKLIVEASNYLTSTGSGTDTIYERTYTRIEKDIRTHRAFQTGGTYVLTTSEVKQVDDFIAGSFNGPLTASQNELYNRLVRGETNYPIWVPVARKISNSTPQPGSTPPGDISTPPSLCNAPVNTALGKPYIYIRTADDATREYGKPWRRTQEWTGFDVVDTLIYQNQ